MPNLLFAEALLTMFPLFLFLFSLNTPPLLTSMVSLPSEISLFIGMLVLVLAIPGFLLYRSHRRNLRYLRMLRKTDAEMHQQIKLRQQTQQQLDFSSFLITGLEKNLQEPMERMKQHLRHLSEDKVTGKQKQESLASLEETRLFLHSLLKDVLMLSNDDEQQLDSGGMEFDLHRLLNNLHAAALRERAELSRTRVRIELQPEEVWKDSFFIHSNPEKIRHVLLTLVKHSLRYTYQGKIRIGYRRMENQLLYFVENTGIGFTPSEYERLFNYLGGGVLPGNFSTASVNMDLVVAGEVTRRMKGKIWTELTRDSSTRFFMKLPFTWPAHTHPLRRNQPEHSVESLIEESQSYQWEGKKILVVEDSRMAFELITKMFKDSGAEFVMEPDGIKALNRCRTDPDIDLVLMDIQLPFMDGYDATREIKKIRPDLPVIAQTANALSNDRKKALNAGCDDYLSKPIDADEMGAKVQSFLFPVE
jgi:CheY-like chemotaxis protein